MDRQRVERSVTGGPQPTESVGIAATAPITARYPIRDASGVLVAVHCRQERTGGKRMWWERPDGTPGLGGLPLADLPLYGINRLTAGPTVVLVEGEKAAEALLAAGIQAVGTVTGASATPSSARLTELAGRSVYLWPDSDAVGRDHMERIATILEQLGVASLQWIEPPAEVPSGWDAADADPETVAELISTARVLPLIPGRIGGTETVEIRRPIGARIVRMSEVIAEQVAWLWPGRIPAGKLTILDGDPGTGKSTISIDLAARVSTGQPMPGDTTSRPPTGVVLLSAEDGLADTIRPRLDAAGADAARVVALAAIVNADGIERLPSLPGDLARLEDAIRANDAALVVVDVLMAYLDRAINAHRDQDVRGALAQLAAVAEHTGAAILVLRHLNKSSGGPAIYRGGGSIGIIGAARSALVVGRDPDDETRMVLAVAKANLAPTASSLAYRIVDRDGVGAIDWGEVTAHTAAELLAARSEATAEERTALDDARVLLAECLANGPVSAKEVRAEARSAGVANRTLDRAKAALHIVARKVGRPGEHGQRWEWSLPEGRQEPPKHANLEAWRTSSPLGVLQHERDGVPPEPFGRRDEDPSTDPGLPARREDHTDGLFLISPQQDAGAPTREPSRSAAEEWEAI